MVGITLAQAEAKLAQALTSMEKALEAKEYAMSSPDGSRGATMQDLDLIQKNIDYWQGWIVRLSRSSTKGGIRLAVPGRQ